ncbi:MAG: hypothetical protein KDE67_00280 [Sphingobium sp.]|nr:hypothetical protein [Sphingobium sp.]MCP5397690.1 hypothetical protein [Sphingomonas sp.]
MKTNKTPDPGSGTFFDEYVDLRDPEGTILTKLIMEYYDKVRPTKRKRHRKTLEFRIRRLAANALRAYYFRDCPAVLFIAKADAEQQANKPGWMRHGALGKLVRPLANAKLFHRIRGKKMPWNSNQASWASSYWATKTLLRMALQSGVRKESIYRPIPLDELVQLYAPKPNAKFDTMKGEFIHPAKGKRIWFDPTPETKEWTATLEAINVHYRQQTIALGLTPAELEAWLAKRNADPDRKGAPYRLPEMFSTDIRRIFNNGDEANPRFDEGGRLFGGWWMHIPEELREAITINGEKTVEIDYSHCHPRMLYHQRDLNGEGELYILPEITAYEAETGVEPGTYRPYVKWLMQVLINGKRRPAAVMPPSKIATPPDLSIHQVVDFIKARHEPIADTFGTGAGLGLMRLESDIALEIISTAMTEGWTVLSVHDSFITTIDNQDRLKSLMIDAYVRRLGREPVFKE